MVRIIIASILVLGLYVKALEVTHDKSSGISAINFNSDKDPYLNWTIWRYHEKITKDNISLAEVVATLTPKARNYKYSVTQTGDFYYAIVKDSKVISAITTEPVSEKDITPPPKMSIIYEYKDDTLYLTWDAPGIKNYEQIAYYDVIIDGKISRRLAPAVSEIQVCKLKSLPNHNTKIEVVAVDKALNRSPLSDPFTVLHAPNLSIASQDRIAFNKDLATSKMYGKVGEKVDYRAKIHNTGSKVAKDVEIEIKDTQNKTIFSKTIPEIAPSSFSEISWSYTGQTAGEHTQTITIDPKNRVNDVNRQDNQVTFKIGVPQNDVYIAWYGSHKDINNCNVRQVVSRPQTVKELQRRGIITCRWGGVSEKPGYVKDYINFMKAGFDGMMIDEIFMYEKTAQVLKDELIEFRKLYPNKFIAVWTVGSNSTPEVAELVKNGTISLLMLEVYDKPGSKNIRVPEAIANMRKLGIADKVVIGLVTAGHWDNFAPPAEYAAHVIKQMKMIKEQAPEMPGVAFWDASGADEVMQKVDAASYDIFVLNKL